MRLASTLAFLLVLAFPADASWWLRSGNSKTFTFKNLPQSLWSQGRPLEQKKPPAVTVHLPDNYSKKHSYPLLVYMGAARGESGHRAEFLRGIFGAEDLILVSMPLFKNPADIKKHREMANIHELAIEPGQAGLLWSCYQPMLEKVFSEIPNIDRDRTFIGGFSNGAHATAVLLNDAVAGPGLRSYFTHFYFVEGGHFLQLTASLPDATLLFMQGEHRAPWLENAAKPLRWNVRIGVEVRTMPGVGHGFPAAEKNWLAAWVRKKANLP